MLRVTVELIPNGNEAVKKTLGVCHIANVDKTSDEVFTYSITEMLPDWCHRWTARDVHRHPNIFQFLQRIFEKRV